MNANDTQHDSALDQLAEQNAVTDDVGAPTPQPEPANDPEKLLRLVMLLKKKLAQTVQELSTTQGQSKVLEGQLSLLKQLLEKTQRHNETIKEELRRTRDELSQSHDSSQQSELQEQQQKKIRDLQSELRSQTLKIEELNDLLHEEKTVATMQKQRLEKLAHGIKERDKRIAELQQYEQSLRKASDQRQQLEKALEEASQQLHSIETALEQARGELQEQQQHSEQLQRVIHYLRERAEESNLEKKQLQEAFQGVQEQIANLQSDNAALADRYQSAAADSQRDQALRQTLDNELTALKEEHKQIKGRLIAVQGDLSGKENALLQAHQIIEQIKLDRKQLLQRLEEKKNQTEKQRQDLVELARHNTALVEELRHEQAALSLLKNNYDSQQRHLAEVEEQQTMLQASLAQAKAECEELARWRPQAEALEQQTLELEQALTAARQQLETLQLQRDEEQQRHGEALAAQRDALALSHRQSADLQSHVERLQEQLADKEELAERFQALAAQHETSLAAIKTLERRENDYKQAIAQRDDDLEGAADERQGLLEQLAQRSDELSERDKIIEEKEAALKIAHHHLAKKVKESTMLSEKNRELENSLADAEGRLVKSTAQADELLAKLEEQRQQRRQQEEQHQRERRESEEHQRSWEKKYFDLWRDFQASEQQRQELHDSLQQQKQRLQKYLQLELMLKNLGSGDAAAWEGAKPHNGTTAPPLYKANGKEMEPPAPPPAAAAESRLSRPYSPAPPPPPAAAPSLAKDNGDPQPHHSRAEPVADSLFGMAEPSLKHKEHLFD